MSHWEGEEKESFLTFTLGDEQFAASIHQVREILEMQAITRIPGSSPFARGILNLRGNILPVFDTHLKFGLEAKAPTSNTRIIVLEIKHNSEILHVGAIVDSAREVVQFSPKSIQNPPSMDDYKKAIFILGIVKLEDDFVMLVDLNKVFSASDVENLSPIL